MVILTISFIGFTRSLGKGSASGSEPEACALSQDALSEARSQAAFLKKRVVSSGCSDRVRRLQLCKRESEWEKGSQRGSGAIAEYM